MYQAVVDPVAANLYLSALVACLPLVGFFVLLLGVKMTSYKAAALSLLAALIVAIFAFKMPLNLALLSALEGSCYGLFPIGYILVVAVCFYQVTVKSGRFEDLRKFFNLVGDGDLRIQVLLIAYCFGTLLEAISGFGAPVAIVATMLMALGMKPMKSAVIALVANTVPVAFSGAGTPLITAGIVASGGDAVMASAITSHIAYILARQIPVYAIVLPFVILAMVDGLKGIKECWVEALVVGFSYALSCWACVNYFAFEMASLVSSLVSLLVSIFILSIWKPKGEKEFEKRHHIKSPKELSEVPSAVEAWMALAPYVVVVAVFALAKTLGSSFLDTYSIRIAWPGLSGNLLDIYGSDPGTTFTLNWLSTPGTLLLISTLIVILIYHCFNNNGKNRLGAQEIQHALTRTFSQMKFSLLTIVLVLAFAYVMNFSGLIASIAAVLATTGVAFAFFSPVVGWIGTAVTGSCTSSTALFSVLQYNVASSVFNGVSPDLLVASNILGSVAGKMVSPQSLAIAASAIGEQEGDIAKNTFPYSLAFLGILCVSTAIIVVFVPWLVS